MLRGVSVLKPQVLGFPTEAAPIVTRPVPGILQANQPIEEEFYGRGVVLSPPMRRYITVSRLLRSNELPEDGPYGYGVVLRGSKLVSAVTTKPFPKVLYGTYLEPEFAGWGKVLGFPPKHTVPSTHIYWLPNAATCPGKSVLAVEINNGASYTTIFKSLGGTVNGAASGTGYTFTTASQFGSITFTSDGTNWWITGLTFS